MRPDHAQTLKVIDPCHVMMMMTCVGYRSLLYRVCHRDPCYALFVNLFQDLAFFVKPETNKMYGHWMFNRAAKALRTPGGSCLHFETLDTWHSRPRLQHFHAAKNSSFVLAAVSKFGGFQFLNLRVRVVQRLSRRNEQTCRLKSGKKELCLASPAALMAAWDFSPGTGAPGPGAGMEYHVVPAIAHNLSDILFHAHANREGVSVRLPVPSPVYIYISDAGGFSRQHARS
jgi:hypothetical protein